MSCGVGRRHGSDPVLLWLLQRPAAVVPIGPIAWELPHATGAALKKAKKKNKNKKTPTFVCDSADYSPGYVLAGRASVSSKF